MMAAWRAAARGAASRAEWPEAARAILAARQEWTAADAGFLARCLRHANRPDAAREALALAPHATHAAATEARLLGLPAPPAAPPHDARLLLDIQGLLGFLARHGAISGIERVQAGVLGALLDGSAGPAGGNARAVFLDRGDATLWAPRAADLKRLLQAAGQGADAATLRRLAEAAQDDAAPLTPHAQATLVVLGAFWSHAGDIGPMLALKRRGLRIAALVYDLFPATNPEFTTPETVHRFDTALNEGLLLWDFALCISRHCAETLATVATARGFTPPPTAVVPLAHDFSTRGEPTPDWLDRFPQALQDIRGRDYVLCVGTIEPRKNHALLFRCWQRMLAAGDNPPPLVLAGRMGWGVADLMAQLAATRNLDGRIMLAPGLSDLELEALYRGALFTVLPSHGEGWGLPVGESLSAGRPCIASSATAIPEVAGDLVSYADPGSVPEWLAAIRRWLHDRAALEAAAAEIARRFQPRRWPEVAGHLLEQAASLAAAPPRAPPAPLMLRTGRPVLAGGALPALPGAVQAAQALGQCVALAEGWHASEADHTWMRGTLAVLLLRTTEPPGSEVALQLVCRTVPWPNPNRVTLRLNQGAPVVSPVPHGVHFAAWVRGRVAEGGLLRVLLELDHEGAAHPSDPRRLTLALETVQLLRAAQAPDWSPPAPPAQAAQAPPPPPEDFPDDPPADARWPGGATGLWLRATAPLRSLRLRAEAAYAQADWPAAARLYAAYLARRPEDAALRWRMARALALGGDAAGAAEQFARLPGAGEPLAAALAALARARAPGPALFLDIGPLLAPHDARFALRRWRLGVARALLARPGCLAAIAGPGGARLVPGWLAGPLLAGARVALPEAALPPLRPLAGERVVLLAPGAEAWGAARRAGAMLVLAAPGDAAGTDAQCPPVCTEPELPGAPPPPALRLHGYLLTDADPALLGAVLGLLRADGTPLPPLLGLEGAAAGVMPLGLPDDAALLPVLRQARVAVTSGEGWPLLGLAAAQAGVPLLAIDPLDLRGSAARLAGLLADPAARAAPALAARPAPPPECDWAALAERLAMLPPQAIAAPPPPPFDTSAPPALGWALGVSAGAPP